MKRTLVALLALSVMTAGIAAYAAPGTIVYRGRLLDSTGNVVNSAGLSMKFEVYSDLIGGTMLYADYHDGTSDPLVAVEDGMYYALLGDDTDNHGATYTDLAEALAADDTVFLQVTIGATALTPREQLQAVPYALSSGSSGASATKELDNLSSVAINTSLLPGVDDSIDLGDATHQWQDIYLSGNLYADGTALDVTKIVTTDASQTLTNKTIVPANNSIELASANILVGDGSDEAQAVAMTGDIAITNAGVTAIQPNAVALGTDTTGDYVATVTAGDGLTGDGSGEGSTPTMAVNVDDSSIEIDTDTLRVKALGVTNAMLAGSIANAKLTNSSVTVTAGDGLSDGGAVSLGGTVTINVDEGDGLQITGGQVAVDNTVVRTSGVQTINGVKTFGSIPVLPASDPTQANEAVRKAYVDSVASGLTWKDAVLVASTANLDLDGTETIDGVAVVADDRVLVKNQTTGSENGIYIVAAGAWSRAEDLDSSDEIKGSAVFATDGTTQGGTAWVCTNQGTPVLDTTALTFTQFASPGTYTAGDGLTLTGLEFDVNYDGTTIGLSGNNLYVPNGGIDTDQLAAAAVTNAKIDTNAVTLATQTTGNYVATVTDAGGTTIANSGAENAAVTVAVNYDDTTIGLNANDLEVKDNGISLAKMADNSVDTAELVADAVTTAKIEDGTILNADIAAAAGIVDTKLATISTANKVSGSAVQLNGTGGLEDDTGLAIKEATGSGLTIDANGIRVTISNKLDANAAPDADNDVNDATAPNGIGYTVGSLWVDTTNDNEYICVDATDSAAVWRLNAPLEPQTTSGGTYVNRSLPGGWL